MEKLPMNRVCIATGIAGVLIAGPAPPGVGASFRDTAAPRGEVRNAHGSPPGVAAEQEGRADQEAGTAQDDKSKKPALTIRATPAISFSPARVRALAELKGGPDDLQDYYCLAVEWDWGDQTKSEESTDCEPYEAGVSQVTRRFSGEHTYHYAGKYRVMVRLKRNDKVMAAANTVVQVRPGLRDIGN